MLRGKCISSYRSKNTGKKTFVFNVTGTEEELGQYLEIQQERFPKGKWKNDDGTVNYWSTAPSSDNIALQITTNGNIVEDTTGIDLKASANARYDHTYESIRKQLQGAGGVQGGRSTPEPTPAPVNEERGDGLDKD